MSNIFAGSDESRDVERFNVVATDELSWEDGGAAGFWIKNLYSNAETGEASTLMKVDAGAFAGDHAHDLTEQILVLEGSFYDQTRTYEKGDFVVRPPGTTHATGSRDGAVVMLMFSTAI